MLMIYVYATRTYPVLWFCPVQCRADQGDASCRHAILRRFQTVRAHSNA